MGRGDATIEGKGTVRQLVELRPPRTVGPAAARRRRDRNEFNNSCPKTPAGSDDLDAVCSAADIVEVPYVRGSGWASEGMT